MLRESVVLVGVHDAVVVAVDDGEEAGVVAVCFFEEEFFEHVLFVLETDLSLEDLHEDGLELRVHLVLGFGLPLRFGSEVEAVHVGQRHDELQEPA